MLRRGAMRLKAAAGTVQQQARTMSNSMKEINTFLVDEQLHGEAFRIFLELILWWHFNREIFPTMPTNLFVQYFKMFLADDISNSLLQQVRVHFEDVTFPNYLVLLAQAKVSEFQIVTQNWICTP